MAHQNIVPDSVDRTSDSAPTATEEQTLINNQLNIETQAPFTTVQRKKRRADSPLSEVASNARYSLRHPRGGRVRPGGTTGGDSIHCNGALQTVSSSEAGVDQLFQQKQPLDRVTPVRAEKGDMDLMLPVTAFGPEVDFTAGSTAKQGCEKEKDSRAIGYVSKLKSLLQEARGLAIAAGRSDIEESIKATIAVADGNGKAIPKKTVATATKSYAEATAKGVGTSTKDVEKSNQNNGSSRAKQQLKKHQIVVITPEIPQQSINQRQIRDGLNKALNSPIIIGVSLSAKGNIVLSLNNYTPEAFLNRKDKWEQVFTNLFSIKHVSKPETWLKLVAYLPESGEEGFIEDLKTFYKIDVVGTFCWMKRPEEGRLTGSFCFSVRTEAERNTALQGLWIGGFRVKVVNLRTFSRRTQCYRCQGFAHNPNTCKNGLKCRYCAQKHPTKAHRCPTCNSSELCSHITVKCANCNAAHPADYSECEVKKAIYV